MKESEAKEKWCPYASCPEDNWVKKFGQNRDERGRPLGGAYCIASDCMAWRGYPQPYDKAQEPEGYCGLAGKP